MATALTAAALTAAALVSATGADPRPGADPPAGAGALPTPMVTLVPDDGSSSASAATDGLCAPRHSHVIYGTPGNDIIHGTSGHDVVCGLGGDDTITGGGGIDTLIGGNGNDTLVGGDGSDLVFGEGGTDSITGGNAADLLNGGDGDDRLAGGRGADGLSGGDGSDTLAAGDDDDRLFGGPGDDSLEGQDGDDSLFGDAGTDTADGHRGTDTCIDNESEISCEQGSAALDPYAEPVPIDDAEAAPSEFTVDNVFPGMAIHLVTGGGIWPWDVEVLVARDYMQGEIGDTMPGGAWQITIPDDAAPLRAGSTLTLPYNPDRLDGFPEEDLRIFAYDPRAQRWLPTSDDQDVDTVNHTVTTAMRHGSVYAVVSIPPRD